MYAGASWAAAWPYMGWTGAETSNPTLFIVSTGIAAGAGVIPDLDHPDARPTKHFGVLTGLVSKVVASASGGHRLGTHSFLFAAMLGIGTWGTTFLPDDWARLIAAIACSFCVSIGVTLVGPSLGMRIHPSATVAATIIPAWYAWTEYETLVPLLPVLAAGGVLCHILCDVVTKGGVPVCWPFSKKRFALSLFRVGGTGEMVATLIGSLAFLGAVYHATSFLT